MPKTLLEMAAEIITAQATHSRMSSEDLSDSLEMVFDSLKTLKSKEEGLPVKEEKAERIREQVKSDPMASIHKDKVICLECLQEFRQLSQGHLKSHGMSLKEYKKKYGFRSRQPLSAKNLTTRRKKLAKERGLAERLAQYRGRGRVSSKS